MQNIGERLEEARKRKGISIREAAEATKVRGDYLHKFESSQFDINLPDIYVRGFLRAYANYLGLTGEKIVNDYNALGHGRPEPKGLNREIYGRMDVTVGSSKEEAKEPENKGNSEDEANPATFKPRPGPLPYIDRSLIIKGVAVLAAVVAVVFVIIIGVNALSKPETIEEPSPATTTAEVTSPEITIHALNNVRIKVVDESTGTELFQGAIARGDNRSFTMVTSLLVTADFCENVDIEKQGSRFPTGLTGRNRFRIE
jgi:cytoskeleton protein RodZ